MNTPFFEKINQEILKNQSRPKAILPVDDHNRFALEMQQFRSGGSHNADFVQKYLENVGQQIEKAQSISLSFFEKHFLYNENELGEQPQKPLNIQKFEYILQCLDTIITGSKCNPSVAKASSKFLFQTLFHKDEYDDIKGFCGNSGSDYYFENMYWSMTHIFNFKNKYGVEFTAAEQARYDYYLQEVFTENWALNILDYPNQTQSSHKYKSLGENILELWLNKSYSNVEEITKLKDILLEDPYDTAVQSLQPIFDKVILEKSIDLNPTLSKNSNNFKI